MLKKADDQDAEGEKGKKDLVDSLNKISAKKKLFELNEPKVLVFVGGLGSAILGFNQPVYGLIIGRLMTILSVPMD